jgi:uncharacterized protein YigE (DUF2233 family)
MYYRLTYSPEDKRMARRKKRRLLRAGEYLGAILLSVLVVAVVGLFWWVKNLSAEVSQLRARVEISSADFKASPKRATPLRQVQDNNVAERVSHNNHSYDTYTVDLAKTPVRLYFRDGKGNKLGTLQNLKEYLESGSGELLFGTNAGMFTEDGQPLGLFVEGGREVVPLNLWDGKDNFYLKPNGVFALTDERAYIVESSQYKDVAAGTRVEFATQSGPMLVVAGNMHPKINQRSTNVNIRSGVGIISPTKIVFAISNEPVNFYDFATLFRDRFKCKDALYLDGAISKMYLPALKRYDVSGDFAGMIAVTKGADLSE